MMPKEALTDRAIRNEVIPGLPLSTICELLTRFRPDELAQEPLQPGELHFELLELVLIEVQLVFKYSKTPHLSHNFIA